MKLDWAASDHKDAMESRLLSYTQMTEQLEDTSKLEKDKVWFKKEKEEKKFLFSNHSSSLTLTKIFVEAVFNFLINQL